MALVFHPAPGRPAPRGTSPRGPWLRPLVVTLVLACLIAGPLRFVGRQTWVVSVACAGAGAVALVVGARRLSRLKERTGRLARCRLCGQAVEGDIEPQPAADPRPMSRCPECGSLYPDAP